MRKTQQRASGFTLIELMVVVCIVGILASVAIPNFQRYVLRTRVSERDTIMLRIKQAIVDHYVREGTLAPRGMGGFGWVAVGNWNPSYPPTGVKRPMVNNQAGWNQYFTGFDGSGNIAGEIEGGLYYSYQFWAIDLPGWSEIQVQAVGDLDSNGVRSSKWQLFTRMQGGYPPNPITPQWPPPGREMDEGGTFRDDVF